MAPRLGSGRPEQVECVCSGDQLLQPEASDTESNVIMTARPTFHGMAMATLYVVLLALCSGASFLLGRSAARSELAQAAAEEDAELKALRQAFGPLRHSRDAEEWIVRDFFGAERGGVFVDVGANHHQRFSNTFHLERELGWSGVAVEPQTQFADGYKRHRPRTTFVPLFVSDVSNREATLYISTTNDLVASSSREFTQSSGGGATPTRVTTTTLDDLLTRLGVSRIDFLTMDIELAEPQALAGFSIDRFKPRLVCIEAHLPVRQQILDYFARHGYVLLGKYWRADLENFWFAPLGSGPH